MRWVLLGAATLAVMDAAAPLLPDVDNLKPDVVYLVTFPGSGNTWIRHLVQQGTQVYAGSIFKEHDLQDRGFPKDDGNVGKFQTLSVIKSHGMALCNIPVDRYAGGKTRPEDPKLLTSCETKVAINKLHHGWPRVSVVRHPCAAFIADFRRETYEKRRTASGGADGTHKRDGREHTATFQFEATDPDWSAFVDKKIPMLRNFYDDLYRRDDANIPQITLTYEYFLSEPRRALTELFDFLVDIKPQLASRAPGKPSASPAIHFLDRGTSAFLRNASVWMVENAMRDLEGHEHRSHANDTARSHWTNSNAVDELCRLMEPHWHRGSAWWGQDCRETCASY